MSGVWLLVCCVLFAVVYCLGAGWRFVGCCVCVVGHCLVSAGWCVCVLSSCWLMRAVRWMVAVGWLLVVVVCCVLFDGC